jgi:HD-GYP domain-containing protein (c-di-GMP phosphodiesterase class II)
LLIVPLEEAKPGMTLAMTVTHPDHPEQDLLRRNFVLDQAVIDKMRHLGIGHIFVDYPGLDDLDKYLAPTLSPERQALYQQVKKGFNAFQKANSPILDFDDYYKGTRDFITTLLSNGRNPIYLDELSTRMGADAVRHSMAVAHMALIIGIKLERYLIQQRHRLAPAQAREVVNLGVAGMLHDIGKTRLPESLQRQHMLCAVNDAQRAEWEAHTRHGYEMVRDEVEPTAAAAILHHHQHFDGTGFPVRETAGFKDRFSGQRIHIFARILCAANLFDRLTMSEDGKRRRANIEILRIMEQRYAALLDPEILQVLPKVVPPYPPGGRVTLSDGRKAIVVALDPENPYSPTVKPVGKDGWELLPEPIVLSQQKALSIAA